MKLSLIIPTYNRPHDIARLLRNLNLQIRKPDEVIIVDASETTETKVFVESSLEEFAFPVHYYSHEKGLTRQRNFGVEKARHDIIGFSDDDTIYSTDFMTRILAVFDNDRARRIGGVSGLIFNVMPSNIQIIDDYLRNGSKKAEFAAFMKCFINSGKDNWRTVLRKGLERIVFLQKAREGTFCPVRCRFYGIEKPFAGTRAVDYLRGIAFYRKEVFEHVKYSEFFEDYGFGEDVHFSLQVGKRWKLVEVGEAFGYHLHAASGRPDLFKIGYMHARNYFYIFKTYENRNILSYFVFWYFFYMSAILEFLPALVGKSSLHRTTLFLGRIYGGFACALQN